MRKERKQKTRDSASSSSSEKDHEHCGDNHTSRTDPLPSYVAAVKDAANYKPDRRTMVICLDGTGDRFDNDNSNVVHFVSCLKKHSLEKQVTYYQSGIGTYDDGGLKNGFSAAMDMAGWSIPVNGVAGELEG